MSEFDNSRFEQAAIATVEEATPVAQAQPVVEPITEPTPVANEVKAEIIETPVVEKATEIITEPTIKETPVVAETPTEVNFEEEAYKLIAEKQTPIAETKEVEYEPEYLAYKEYLKDPQVQAVLEARKQGKSVTDLINEINADDPSKLSNVELYERELDSYGLTPEEKQEELDKFTDGMSPLERAKAIQPIKEKLVAAYNQKLEQFITAPKKLEADAQLRIQENAQKGQERLKNILAQNEFLGLELTPTRKKEIEKYVNENCYPDKNGNYNVEQAFNDAIVKNYGVELVKANQSKVEAKAKTEIFKEVTRPSKEMTSNSAASLNSPEVDDFSSVMRGINQHAFNL
jgi:hypothetical protein